jgi:hypothetical protein
MSEASNAETTEAASGKRLSRLRKHGDTPWSPEAATFSGLIAASIGLWILVRGVMKKLAATLQRVLSSSQDLLLSRTCRAVTKSSHGRVRPMLTITRFQVRSILWVCAPSLLWSLFLQTTTLCIDPFVLPMIERRLPPKIAFLIRWLWVILFSMTMMYAWNIGPGSYVFYIRQALPFTPMPILAGLALAVAILFWIGAERHSLNPSKRVRDTIFVIGLVFFSAKVVLATNAMDMPFLRQHLRSPVLSNIHMFFAGKKSDKSKTGEETPNLTFNAFARNSKVLPLHVVMMLIESWGETSRGLATMVDEINEEGFKVRVHGFTTYRGSTLSGEFRELCSKYVQPSDGLTDKAAGLDCAPKFFKENGYEVVGLHGYKKSFYARATFWDRFGLKKGFFEEELNTLPHCEGAFTGICDQNLIKYGMNWIDASEKPAFLYMLTLSSHEPVNMAAQGLPGKHFSNVEVVHPTQVITRRAISDLLDRLKEGQHRKCTLVYVVGDHQPPSASAKGGIFESQKVPYIAFTDNCPAS